MRLIEPIGLLYGPTADEAMQAGLALPLAGGPGAFTLARLVAPGEPATLLPVAAIPPDWRAEAHRVSTAPPPWAGMPTDRPVLMGIVNVTPDSFSDPGRHAGHDDAIAAGHAMAAAGADILDVGGESTRPGALPVAVEEEQRRVLPVIRALVAAGHCVSVDTRNAATMGAALDAGARIVNDVSALRHDPCAAPLLARRGCPVVLMHMRGTPATMQARARYAHPAYEILDELADAVRRAADAGIARDRIAIDPGIGFAKDVSQNRELIYRMPLFTNLGSRIMLGVSRKSLIGQINQEPDPLRRIPGSLAAALLGWHGGASILRTHDVAETVQALRTWHTLQTCDGDNSATHGSISPPIRGTPTTMEA